MKKYQRIANSPWLFYAGVLIALLPIMIYRDFTPDNELRYLSIADEALRNHDFFAFYNHGIPYADKPPLYLWFVMLCRWIAGRHLLWLLALGSLLPAFGVIAVMDRWTNLSGRRTASRMMLMTSAYFLGAAVILRMDMLMCLFIVLSLYTFWKMYEGKAKKRDKWLFPIYLFLALFTKGPLGILIPLFSILVFLICRRQLKQFSKYWGWRTWGVLLALCALWFAGVYADGGKEYLNNLLFHQTIDRAVDSFHHKRPFHYYLVAVWYIIAPWSIYVVGAIIADMRHLSRLSKLQQFFIAVSLTTLVLLSCISGKLQIYFLPAIPFMVYAAMMSLPKYQDNLKAKIAIGFPSGIFALALPAAGAAVYFGWVGDLGSAFLYDAATILTAGGFYGLIMLVRKGVCPAVKATSVTLLAALFVGGWALSDLNDSMGYGAVCTKAKEISIQSNIDNFYVWKMKRPENMDVYLGKDVIIIEGDSMPDISGLAPGLLLLKEEDAKSLRIQPSDIVGPYAIIKVD